MSILANESSDKLFTPRKMEDEVPKASCLDILYEYCLLLWDGLGFFGFDTTKLPRLKGVKVNFCTKFKSLKWILMTLITMIIVVLVVYQEFSKLGSLKQQTISLIVKDKFWYDANRAIPLRWVHWFYIDEIFPHVREYQHLNQNDSSKFQHA